jgi:hypothetical protein
MCGRNFASCICSANIFANGKLIHLNSNEENLPEQDGTDQPQVELVTRLSADESPIKPPKDPDQDIVKELRLEMRKLQAEVKSLKAASGDAASQDDGSSKTVRKGVPDKPTKPKKPAAKPSDSPKQDKGKSNMTTSSAMNEGMIQAPSPPYALSENGRQRYLGTQWDGQIDHSPGPSTVKSIQPRQ